MAKRKSSRKMVKAHGRPTRKDGKPYRGTCRKCGRDHSTSAHWSHAKGPKTKGPRGGTSYKSTRKRKTTTKAPSFKRTRYGKVTAKMRATGSAAFARAVAKGKRSRRR